jgi:hypothetical protein
VICNMAQAMPVATIGAKQRRSRVRLDNTLTVVLKTRSSTRHQYYRRVSSCQVSPRHQNVESKKKVSGSLLAQRKSLRDEWMFRLLQLGERLWRVRGVQSSSVKHSRESLFCRLQRDSMLIASG